MKREARIPTYDPAEILSGSVPAIDFQMHTVFTDGRSEAAEHVEAAVRSGLSAIAFTEHVSRNEAWLQEWYPDYLAEIDRLRADRDELLILRGVEAKAADYEGSLNVSEEILDESEIILGVVHAFPKDATVQYENLTDLEPELALETELRATLGLLQNPRIDVIAHVGGVSLKYFGRFPMESFDEVIRVAADRGIAFEINGKYHRTRIRALLEMCARWGARVTLGSDAHEAGDVGSVVEYVRQEVME